MCRQDWHSACMQMVTCCEKEVWQSGHLLGMSLQHILFYARNGNVTACCGNVTACCGNVTACNGNVTACHGNVTACHGNVTACNGNVTACLQHCMVMDCPFLEFRFDMDPQTHRACIPPFQARRQTVHTTCTCRLCMHCLDYHGEIMQCRLDQLQHYVG